MLSVSDTSSTSMKPAKAPSFVPVCSCVESELRECGEHLAMLQKVYSERHARKKGEHSEHFRNRAWSRLG